MRTHLAAAAISRRLLLAGGVCLCCLPRRLRAAPPAAFAEVAAGIHVRRGFDADASADNRDAIANIGFIIGARSVLVTDPGGSLDDGMALRAAIRAATDKPVSHVVLSHIHPDHGFGAAAFAPDRPAFVGHPNLPAAQAARGAFYQARLEAMLGPGQAAVVAPTIPVAGELRIDLGDRALTLRAHPPAHTHTDVSVFDHATGTLLPADLLFVGRIPSLDGSLAGWLPELAALAAWRSARVVPGHGPVSVDLARAAADLSRYLTTLRDETRAAIAAGRDLAATAETVGLSERPRWALFDDYHVRNVTEAYKELEWE